MTVGTFPSLYDLSVDPIWHLVTLYEELLPYSNARLPVISFNRSYLSSD